MDFSELLHFELQRKGMVIKMKKITFIIISLLALIMMLSGCSQNDGYSIKICGFSDSISEAAHKLEYSEWSKDSFIDSKAEKRITISVGDSQIEADYIETEKRFSEYYNTHKYKDRNNNEFFITENGQLSLYFFGRSAASTETAKIYTESECKDIACAFLSDIVDIADYSVRSEFDTDRKIYEFYFEKYADGFLCADQANIRVEETGHIYSFSSWMLGQISTDITTNFNRDAVEAQIISKLDKEYARAKEVYDAVEYENFQYTLTKASKDKYALICSVDVNCKKSHGEYTSIIPERIELLIQ